MRLTDKVAIITGSSQSIGKAVAIRFAREGASVIINSHDHFERAEIVAEEIRSGGGQALAIQADVSDESQVKELVQKTAEKFGTIDILVNNAAIDPRCDWEKITVEDWDRLMAVNVRSQFICSQAVYPFMKKQGRGKIINVSSVTFHLGMKGYVHYVASKGAIIGLTRALSREVGADHITVNCITPGAILTETELEKMGSAEAQEKATAMLLQAQAIPARVSASDIEGAFVFLASADSDLITGQTLNVDGGWIMH